MLAQLHREGFIVIEDIVYSKELYDYLVDMNNYSPITQYDTYTKEETTYMEIMGMDSVMLKHLIQGLPQNLQDTLKTTNVDPVNCCVTACTKGYSALPHRDFFDVMDQVDNRSVLASLVLWVCPHDFEGREFVYGKLKYPEPERREPYPWDHPILETIGEIKPKTGIGVLIDLLDPNWWHAVRPLISGGPVLRISISIM